MKLLSLHKLCRAPEVQQACALQCLSLLTSKWLLEQATAHHLDDMVVRLIPLLLLLRNGNEFGGRVMEVVRGSALAKRHSVLKSLSHFSKEDGEGELCVLLMFQAFYCSVEMWVW